MEQGHQAHEIREQELDNKPMNQHPDLLLKWRNLMTSDIHIDEVTLENHQIALVNLMEIEGYEPNPNDLRSRRLLEEILPNLNILVGPNGTPITPEAWRMGKRQAMKNRGWQSHLFNHNDELGQDELIKDKEGAGNCMVVMMVTIPTISIQNPFQIIGRSATNMTMSWVSKTPACHQ